MSDTVDTSRSATRKHKADKPGSGKPNVSKTGPSSPRSEQSATATSDKPNASTRTATAKTTGEKQSDKSQARTALGQPDADSLPALAEAAVRHLSVDKILARCGSSAAMEIARLELNDTSVDNVIVERLSTEVRCGSAALHEVRTIDPLTDIALGGGVANLKDCN